MDDYFEHDEIERRREVNEGMHPPPADGDDWGEPLHDPGWRVSWASDTASGTFTIRARTALDAEALAQESLGLGERLIKVDYLGWRHFREPTNHLRRRQPK